jgi:hypothetical protein
MEGSTLSASPVLSRTLYAFTALVPIEALLIHGALMLYATNLTPTGAVYIARTRFLEVSFYALCGVSFALSFFAMRKVKVHHRWYDDLLRSLVPPIALIVWLMLQRISAFDAAWVGLGERCRYMTAGTALLALCVIAVASRPTSRAAQPETLAAEHNNLETEPPNIAAGTAKQ